MSNTKTKLQRLLEETILGLRLQKFNSHQVNLAILRIEADPEVKKLFERLMGKLVTPEFLGELEGKKCEGSRWHYVALLNIQNRLLKEKLARAEKQLESRIYQKALAEALLPYLPPDLANEIQRKPERPTQPRLAIPELDARRCQALGLPEYEGEFIDWASPQPVAKLLNAIPPGTYGKRIYVKKLQPILKRLKITRFRRSARDPYVYHQPYLLLGDILQSWAHGDGKLGGFIFGTFYRQLRLPLSPDTGKVMKALHRSVTRLTPGLPDSHPLHYVAILTSSDELWMEERSGVLRFHKRARSR